MWHQQREKREREREGGGVGEGEEKTAREQRRKIQVKAYYTGKAPGIPGFQVRAESGEPRCPERR